MLAAIRSKVIGTYPGYQVANKPAIESTSLYLKDKLKRHFKYSFV